MCFVPLVGYQVIPSPCNPPIPPPLGRSGTHGGSVASRGLCGTADDRHDPARVVQRGPPLGEAVPRLPRGVPPGVEMVITFVAVECLLVCYDAAKND